MKLLERKQISDIKAIERKREMDEGAKLAKRVDELRRLSSEEEVRLKIFREETFKRIRGEIDELILEKEGLKQENNNIREETDRMRKVLAKTVEDITNLTTHT